MVRSCLARLLVLAFLLCVPGGRGSLAAQAQEATPVTGVARRVLLDAVASEQPAGHARVAVDRWTFQPGPGEYRQDAFGGPVLLTVDAGRIVAPFGDTERTVATGETIVVPGGQDFALRNPDATVAIVVNVLLVPSGAADFDYDLLSITFEDPINSSTDAMPAGAVRVVLEEWTLAPGAGSAPQEAGALDWFGVIAGRVGVRLEGEQLPFRWTSGEEQEFAPLQPLPSVQAGTLVTVRNVGDEPAVVYHLSIAPVEDGTPVATPAT